jgi:RHS repeat-associated protein
MTTAAICATREVSWSPSFYRGEQYDPDLGLYYLRARYYNPNTGRFLSRDPEDGKANIPVTLHKYLYAAGDPVNLKDPTGRDWEGFAILAADIAEVVASRLFAQAFCGGVVGYVFFEIADAFPKYAAIAAGVGGGAGVLCGAIP